MIWSTTVYVYIYVYIIYNVNYKIMYIYIYIPLEKINFPQYFEDTITVKSYFSKSNGIF